jgi:quinohemoprotein ethanol dehydrogenase
MSEVTSVICRSLSQDPIIQRTDVNRRRVKPCCRAVALASCIALSVLPKVARSVEQASTDWPRYGLDTGETRNSHLTQVNAGNVRHLGLAWSAELTNEASALEGTPLEIDGILYANGGFGAVYAFDAATGRALWTYEPKANEADPRGARRTYGSDRGLAYYKGRIYTATKDGRLVALDAKSGNVSWSVKFIVRGTNGVYSGAPRALDGKIIIGTAGSEFAARGSLTAVDAETGKIAWRFFTVPGNPAEGFEDSAQQMAAKTWSGEWWKYGGGGAPWNGITYDDELRQVYIGTGNAGPWSDKVRSHQGQDNLFTASIIALDANTGRYVWHYQTTPDDVWDYDATADIALTTLKIGGKPHKVLLEANKNGFFYVINRVDGKLIAADKFAPVNWATHIDLRTGRPVEVKGSRYPERRTIIFPSTFGAHDWQATSYNEKIGLVYFPVIHAVSVFTPSRESEALMQQNVGRMLSDQGVDATVRTERPTPGGELVAWDPLARRAVWRISQSSDFNGGTLTTDGNLVFQGLADGHFNAYSADKGHKLWSFDAHMGIMAAPMTYSVAGQQYVCVLAGYGGGGGETAIIGYAGWKWGLPRRVLVFRLGGNAQLPTAPQAVTHLKPVDDVALRLRSAHVTAGGALYGEACTPCHGEAVIANGNAPDLRVSPLALDRTAFRRVLMEGLLVSKGMPRFDDLSDDEIGSLYEYIRARAREDLHSGRDGAAAVLGAESANADEP